ncbi:MAG: sulfatase [Planctomycetota bacterium]|nr:sulfatase [Planctomycetota bacterium]
MRLLLLFLTGVLVAIAFLACGDEPAPTPPSPATDGSTPYDADGRLISGSAPADGPRPNLVVLVIDTLRGDAVGLPGGAEGLMPYVSSLAKEGVSFPDATAPSPWTVPSMTSFLTGMLPSVHGSDAPLRAPRLLGAVTTYAEVLRETFGYETAAYVNGTWFLKRDPVLQGFSTGVNQFALKGLSKIVGGFAKRRDREKPFFLLLHTFEAHDPYGEDSHPWPVLPRQPGRQSGLDLDSITEPWQVTLHYLRDRAERFDLREHFGQKVENMMLRYVHSGYMNNPRPELAAELRADYEGGVRWVDGLVRKAVDQLEAWGMLDNTVLVITSDHGEAFGEHGIIAHGRQLYDELIRVPLVMRGPEPFSGGRVVEGGVGLIDILPTFLDHIGGVPITGVQGRSFLPLLRGESQGRPVFCEEILNRDNTREDVLALVTGVRSRNWKYIVTFDQLKGTVIEEAYDLRADPGEQKDLTLGTGRIDGLVFDDDFCTAVEQARDRIWGAAERSNRLQGSPYAGGRALVTSKRPKACGQ